MNLSYEAVAAGAEAVEKHIERHGPPEPWQGYRCLAEDVLRAALPLINSAEDDALQCRIRYLEEELARVQETL